MAKDHAAGGRDNLNAIGVLKRREIEARVVAPLLEAFAAAFGREQVMALAREVIAKVAREQGELLAEAAGGNTLEHFSGAMEAWTRDDALAIEEIERSEDTLSFDVKRCRFAEMYRALGIEEIGEILSCERDGSLVAGFNPTIQLRRTRTILQGAPSCDFRFRKKSEP